MWPILRSGPEATQKETDKGQADIKAKTDQRLRTAIYIRKQFPKFCISAFEV